MLFARSLLFYLGMITVLLVMLPLLLLVLPFPYAIRYRFLMQWGRFNIWWLGITCALRYRVEGAENIPAGPAIIMAKHQSAWETFALQKVFPPQTWVLKRSLLWIPIFGWGLALLYVIAIDRAAGRAALHQVVTQGMDRLKRGIWVVIFPEGTRTAPGTRRKYNIGGAVLAEKSGHPVVPVAHNAGEFWSRRSFTKRPGVITIVIGPTIQARGRRAGEINREVEEWIEGTMLRISNSYITRRRDC